MDPGFARSQSPNPPHPVNGKSYLPSPNLIPIWRPKPGSLGYWLWLHPSLRQLWGQITWSPLWFFHLRSVPGDIPCLLANSAYGHRRWLSDKESTHQCRRLRRRGFDLWVRKIPWRRKWHPTLVFLPGESHGQRSLVGYSPWSRKQSVITEHACTDEMFSLGLSRYKKEQSNFWMKGIYYMAVFTLAVRCINKDTFNISKLNLELLLEWKLF